VKTTTLLGLLFLLLCCTVKNGYGLPKFKINSSVAAAEKGHRFEILVVIETDEAIKEVSIAPIGPDGFPITARTTTGLSTSADGVVTIDSLSAGSSLTVPFTVQTPSQTGDWRPFGSSNLYSTRDAKIFSFNIAYKKTKDGQEILVRETESISIRYTTSLFLYLLAGVIGVFLGYVVKTITQSLREIDELTAPEIKSLRRLQHLARFIVVVRLPFLLTTIVIGFGVLLSMAQDKIPVNGWFQATALGIGLGILSDEKLITKLRGDGAAGGSSKAEDKKTQLNIKTKTRQHAPETED
jgi:hypothetical protein